MLFFHSPSTDRFYTDADKKIPKDARLLEAGRGVSFLGAQSRADAARAAGREAEAASLKVTAEAIEAAVLTNESEAEKYRAGRRAARNARLVDSDWTQLPDAFGGDKTKKAAWAKYRQELRDFDAGGEDWPLPPVEEK